MCTTQTWPAAGAGCSAAELFSDLEESKMSAPVIDSSQTDLRSPSKV
jgi:hypothetical protein